MTPDPVFSGPASGRPALGAPVWDAFAAAHDIRSAHAAFRTWMFDLALPFWSTAGHDATHGGAREQLGLDGSPAEVGYKRMRVQARQLYAFSHAALMGWPEGEACAREVYDFMIRGGERPQGGWVRRLAPDGQGVIDPAIDLYDQAFVVFGLAWFARLTGAPEPLERARRTLTWVRDQMALAPQGFHNVLPPEPGPRQQNPHMHLLEAVLALHQTSGDAGDLALAHDLVELFRQRLFDPATGTLGEFFDLGWSPERGAAGDHIEPGHQYEWVWLLDLYERLTGADVGAEIDALYRFARAHGTDPQTAVVWDVVGRDGTVKQGSARLWPQTEALKAHIVMHRRDPHGDAGRLIPQVVRNFGGRFFRGCPPGAWMDQLDAAGDPAADKIPTSSLYHVFMSYAELDRLAADMAASK